MCGGGCSRACSGIVKRLIWETLGLSSLQSKKVRFKKEDGEGSHHGDSTSGPVRIRLVVTKEELKRVLRDRNENDPQHTSLEELLNDMVLRDKRVFEVEKNAESHDT